MSIYCLDTSVWIKYLCPDEQEDLATELVSNALSTKLVLPSFAWAEIAPDSAYNAIFFQFFYSVYHLFFRHI